MEFGDYEYRQLVSQLSQFTDKPLNTRNDVIDVLALFLGKPLRGINKYQLEQSADEWLTFIRKIVGKANFERLTNPKWKPTTKRNNGELDEKSITTLATRYVIQKFGYMRTIGYPADDVDEVKQDFQNLIDEYRAEAIEHLLGVPQTIKQPKQSTQILPPEKQTQLETELIDLNNRIEAAIQATRELKELEDNPVFKKYNAYINHGRTPNQARFYLRKANITTILNRHNELQQLSKSLPDLNERAESIIDILQRNQSAKRATEELQQREPPLDLSEVQEIPMNVALKQQLTQQIQAKEQQRIQQREQKLKNIARERAHDDDEYNALIDNISQYVQSHEDVENYFKTLALDVQSVQESLDAIRTGKRFHLTGLSNNERRVIQENLPEALDELFGFLSVNDKVQIRFMCGGKVRYAPNVYNKKQAQELLSNWTEDGLMIQYDDTTHWSDTEGDRTDLPKFFICDWIEFIVNNKVGRSASGGGFPKYYFKRTGEKLTINNKEFSEDEVANALVRYEIFDHAPKTANETQPCIIYALSQLDWSVNQWTKIKDLLYSRIKYRHVPTTAVKLLFEELDIYAKIHDFDTEEVFIINGKTQDKRFGLKKQRKFAIKRIELDIIDKHFMLHDDKTIFGIPSDELIRTLKEQQRLQTFTFNDSAIFKYPLPEYNPIKPEAYLSTNFMTPQQVLNSLKGNFSNEAFKGFNMLLNYMIENNLDIRADSGTAKTYLHKSVRGGNVAMNPIATNAHEITSLDVNSCYPFALSRINAPLGLPQIIKPEMDVMELVKSGAIVFVDCDFTYTPISPIDKPPKASMLTNYDLQKSSIHVQNVRGGYYWSKNKVAEQPFKKLVDDWYELKQTDKSQKRVLNAGIGYLIKKFKPTYYTNYTNGNRYNVNYLGEKDGKDIMANPVDYTVNFTALHSLIISFASLYIHKIFEYCVQHDIPLLYTSTDSIVVNSKDVEKLNDYIGNELGKLKIEAVGNNAIFIKPRLYYINENKYSSLNVQHDFIEKNYPTVRDYYLSLN